MATKAIRQFAVKFKANMDAILSAFLKKQFLKYIFKVAGTLDHIFGMFTSDKM